MPFRNGTRSSSASTECTSSGWSVASPTSTTVSSLQSDDEDVWPRGRMAPALLTKRLAGNENWRTRLLRLHQQSKLISAPRYNGQRNLNIVTQDVHEVYVCVDHYFMGELSVRACGSQVTLARESAAERMFHLIEFVEADLTRPLPTVEPCPMALSQQVFAGRRKRHAHLDRLMDMTRHVGDNDWVLVVDVEAWDGTSDERSSKRPADVVLEIGWYSCRVRDLWRPHALEVAQIRHLIVEEGVHLHNHGHLNHKFDFEPRFGVSELLSRDECVQTLRATVDRMRAEGGRLHLVGHSIDGDRKWLGENMGLQLDGFVDVDLADAYAAFEHNDRRRRLGWLCARFDVTATALHNGGNDAVYTALVCRRMVKVLL